jgi:hypothetical protein
MASKNSKSAASPSMENATTIAQLLDYQRGQVVRLPDFAEGQPFCARLKRPSMMGLAVKGKIPNDLLIAANSLFNGTDTLPQGGVDMQEVYKVINIICEECFVEPSWKELNDNGIQLCDDQFMFIFNYSQTGVKSLVPFRQIGKGAGDSVDGETLRSATE